MDPIVHFLGLSNSLLEGDLVAQLAFGALVLGSLAVELDLGQDGLLGPVVTGGDLLAVELGVELLLVELLESDGLGS